MPRLTQIYTKTGDDGTTALGTKKRVPKDAARVQAYGDVDELNSMVGLALAGGLSPSLGRELRIIQNELFHLGSDLAFPEDAGVERQIPQIEQRHIEKLELLIDRLSADLGPLDNFILPGGSPGAARLHVARTICRRAERGVVTLARKEPVGDHVVGYLNRLSDALFVMARFENQEKGIADPYWDTRA